MRLVIPKPEIEKVKATALIRVEYAVYGNLYHLGLPHFSVNEFYYYAYYAPASDLLTREETLGNFLCDDNPIEPRSEIATPKRQWLGEKSLVYVVGYESCALQVSPSLKGLRLFVYELLDSLGWVKHQLKGRKFVVIYLYEIPSSEAYHCVLLDQETGDRYCLIEATLKSALPF